MIENCLRTMNFSFVFMNFSVLENVASKVGVAQWKTLSRICNLNMLPRVWENEKNLIPDQIYWRILEICIRWKTVKLIWSRSKAKNSNIFFIFADVISWNQSLIYVKENHVMNPTPSLPLGGGVTLFKNGCNGLGMGNFH